MSEMFLDSSFAIALSATSDKFHRKAVEISGLIEAQSIRLITSFIAADAPEFIRGEEPRPRMLKEINVAR